MTATTLHYIFDPLCGWCYAAAPLLDAARSVPGLRIALHGGGMLSGENRRRMTPEWRDYVLPHDRRIAELSGQPFGAAYLDGLLNDPAVVLDSLPPTTAILAAESLAGRGLDLLKAVQRAHYVAGRRIAERAALDELAVAAGLDGAAFAAAYDRLSGAATEAHVTESRTLLARLGGHGFPTLALEGPARHFVRLDTANYLGRPAAWLARLGEATQPPSTSGEPV